MQWCNRKFSFYQTWISVEEKSNIVVSGNPSFFMSLTSVTDTNKNEALHVMMSHKLWEKVSSDTPAVMNGKWRGRWHAIFQTENQWVKGEDFFIQQHLLCCFCYSGISRKWFLSRRWSCPFVSQLVSSRVRTASEPGGTSLLLIRHELPWKHDLWNFRGGSLKYWQYAIVMHFYFSLSSSSWIMRKIRLLLM